MKHVTYTPVNTCSKKIDFDLTDDLRIINLKFQSGCSGNLSAIGKLVDGKKASEIADILSGNPCGLRPTSCADQLSIAIKEALSEEK
ncbi:MAG: TIGR03905 family TSCPD domain-containing protein [Bacilli bacterium]|nr:TIGR03905 family TSCPD domain-containing protein [Bacilli bacterium]